MPTSGTNSRLSATWHRIEKDGRFFARKSRDKQIR
jgi:hypothetical protein